jgi:hypothetical protein
VVKTIEKPVPITILPVFFTHMVKQTHLRSQWEGAVLSLEESRQKRNKIKYLCPNLKQCPSKYLKGQKEHEKLQLGQPVSKPKRDHGPSEYKPRALHTCY